MTDVLTITSHPFPHLVVDGWWDDSHLHDVLSEFPDVNSSGWRRYENGNERKLEGPPSLWGPRTHELFGLIEKRIPDLEQAFGVTNLVMETVGGGYHYIQPGGFLHVHTDFNRSTKSGLYRRLNLLVYLNEAWDEPMGGGNLELWDANAVAMIEPEFNRTVVFETSDHSWHGHPKPAMRARKSVAAYFFTPDAPDGYAGDHSTNWHADAH